MLRYPDMSNRTLVLGETGTGKTVWATHLLSQQAWELYPWTVLDYKGDELLEKIFSIKHPLIKTLKVGDKPPKKPGLYRLRPDVVTDDAAIMEYLWQVYRNEDHGLFLDEGYAVPGGRDCAPLNAIFTQGRARNTPIICCFQRPVYMSRYAVAQASFISHFEEDDTRDQKTAAAFIPPAKAPSGKEISVFTELPKFWSLWRDKGARKTLVLRPGPNPQQVLRGFRERLGIHERKRLGVHA